MALPDATRDDERLTLHVGVRADAPPFSYLPRPMFVAAGKGTATLGKAGYAGYIVYICDRVIDVMKSRRDLTPNEADTGLDFDVEIVQVTADNRFDLLTAETGTKIDILCDPATATYRRVRDHTASVPLYMSGIGFAARIRDGQVNTGGSGRIAVVGKTTAGDYGIKRILDAGEWPNYKERLLAYIHNPSDHAQSVQGAVPASLGIVEAFPTHEQAARAFCSDPEDAKYRFNYYVGDMEIVNRALMVYGTPNCKFERATATYSDDRYTIFMRNPEQADARKARLLMRFSRTLTELVLTNPSLLEEAFQANFERYSRSDKLRIFFWSLYGP
ncbi:hypothetical protein [Paracoccus aurantiacus]|nr:hypothetical protein [Paracoccus aurantiacus]